MENPYVNDPTTVSDDPHAAYTEDHLRQVKEFQARMFGGQPAEVAQRPTPHVPKEASYYLRPTKGTFSKGVYTAPDEPRFPYLVSVKDEAVATKYKDYKPLTDNRLVFRDHIHQLNLFHPYFVEVFNLFLKRCDDRQLIVMSGFTVPETNNLTAHNVGMAIDLLVTNREDLSYIMNTAWLVGFPMILHAGNRSDEMHVHLDIAPKETYIYDGEFYEGPWSLSYVRT